MFLYVDGYANIFSHLLLILYTDRCRSNHEGHNLVKFCYFTAFFFLLTDLVDFHSVAMDEFIA